MACDRTILVPDATAIVQDQDGNELARENIASGATGIIPVGNSEITVVDQDGNVLATESVLATQPKTITVNVAPVDPVQQPLAVTNGGTVLYFDSSRSKSLWQENELNTILANNSINNNESVSTVYDLSGKYIARANGTPPLLDSDVNRNTSMLFDGSNRLVVKKSQASLKNIHGQPSDRIYTIAFWIKKNEDGVQQNLFANATSTADSGFFVLINSSNQLRINIQYSSAGNSILNYTSTKTITISDNWIPVIIQISGESGTINIDGIIENITLSSSFSTQNPPRELAIGDINVASGTGGAKVNLDSFLILNREMTSAETTDYQSYNPTRNNVNFVGLEREYDFSADSLMYSDTSAITNVVNDSDIALVQNKVSNLLGEKNYPLLQSTSTKRPVYKSNIINSKGVARFNPLNFEEFPLIDAETSGSFIYFIGIKNEDSDFGSRPLQGSEDGIYITVTGENYVGEFNDPYLVVHHSVGIEGESVGLLTGDVTNTYQIFAVVREALTTKIVNMNGQVEQITNVNKSLKFTRVGGSARNEWYADGEYLFLKKYNGYMNDQQVIDKINELKLLYNL